MTVGLKPPEAVACEDDAPLSKTGARGTGASTNVSSLQQVLTSPSAYLMDEVCSSFITVLLSDEKPSGYQSMAVVLFFLVN